MFLQLFHMKQFETVNFFFIGIKLHSKKIFQSWMFHMKHKQNVVTKIQRELRKHSVLKTKTFMKI